MPLLNQKSAYGFVHMSLGLALKQLALAEAGNVEEARFHLQQAQLLTNPNDPRLKAALDKLPANGYPPADP